MRPHCLNPVVCAAAKPTSHCRRCSALRLSKDPEIEARRRDRLAEYHASPDTKTELAARISASMHRSLATPEGLEKRREHGRRQHRDYLSRPDIVARVRSPEARAKAASATSDARLSWCPRERRAEYRAMVRSKGLTAAEARAAIEATIPGTAEHARLQIANVRVAQRLRMEREKRQAY